MRGHGQAHPQDSTLVSVTVHQQKVPAGQGGCIFSHIMPGSSNCRRFLDSYLAWSGFTSFPSLEELYYSFHLSTLWCSFLRMPKWNHMYVYIELFKMSWNLQPYEDWTWPYVHQIPCIAGTCPEISIITTECTQRWSQGMCVFVWGALLLGLVILL